MLMKKNKKFRICIFTSVLVLLIIGIGGVYFIMPSRFIIGSGPTVLAPITVFGLSPIDSCSTELLSENIMFAKDLSQTGSENGFYNVEMEYKVKVHEKTTFVLPFARMDNNYAVQIFINGISIQYSSERHLMAYVTRPLTRRRSRSFSGAKQQSVHFLPMYSELEQQPDNSYEILIDTWDSTSNAAVNESDLNQETGSVYMYKFEIDEQGEYHITIKLVAIGENYTSANYMVEWSGSPNKMWSEIGKRKIKIGIDDKQYNYDLSDKLFRFELKV